jgi:hypothetical protein
MKMELQRFVSKNHWLEKAHRKATLPWAQGSAGASVRFGNIIQSTTKSSR